MSKLFQIIMLTTSCILIIVLFHSTCIALPTINTTSGAYYDALVGEYKLIIMINDLQKELQLEDTETAN